jgi:NADPH:quinone reductase
MRAMRARVFKGYGDLELVGLPKPEVADGRVLVRMASAGATPLDHTILSGQFPKAKTPLVLGSEGAGVVEEGGGTEFPAGSRVMFAGGSSSLFDGIWARFGGREVS